MKNTPGRNRTCDSGLFASTLKNKKISRFQHMDTHPNTKKYTRQESNLRPIA